MEKAIINNSLPRQDTSGNILDAHGGATIRQFNGLFYMYGVGYLDTNGDSPLQHYHCYSSTDLMAWTFHGNPLPGGSKGHYFRPYVVHHPDKGYVMCFSYYPVLWDGRIGIAFAENPTGPFKISTDQVTLTHSCPGDHDFFIDDDGSAYLIYTSIAESHSMYIEKLSPDLHGTTKEIYNFGVSGVEAPVMFKRAGFYYALFGRTTNRGSEGADLRVFRSRNALGPYTMIGNINTTSSGKPLIACQQCCVAKIKGAQNDIYLWCGDRWRSHPDGLLAHSYQFWTELKFDEEERIIPFKLKDTFEINIA